MRGRWPKLGTRVHVEWLDIVGYVNCQLSEARPAPCWTEGLLVKNSKDFIVLASSQYKGRTNDESIEGDYTAIPKGVVHAVKRI